MIIILNLLEYKYLVVSLSNFNFFLNKITNLSCLNFKFEKYFLFLKEINKRKF